MHTLEGGSIIHMLLITCNARFAHCLTLKSFCTSVINAEMLDTDVVYDYIESMRYEHPIISKFLVLIGGKTTVVTIPATSKLHTQ